MADQRRRFLTTVNVFMEEMSLAASLVFGAALGGFLGVVFADTNAFKEGNELYVSSALFRFSFAVAILFWMRKLDVWTDKWWYLGLIVLTVWLYRGGVVTMHWVGFNVIPIHVIFLTWIGTVVSISILGRFVIWRKVHKQ